MVHNFQIQKTAIILIEIVKYFFACEIRIINSMRMIHNFLSDTKNNDNSS